MSTYVEGIQLARFHVQFHADSLRMNLQVWVFRVAPRRAGLNLRRDLDVLHMSGCFLDNPELISLKIDYRHVVGDARGLYSKLRSCTP